MAAAKQWRANATSDLGKGKRVTPSTRTFRAAAEEWLAGARANPPTSLNRSQLPFKPSVLRGYEHDLNEYVLDDLGAYRLSDVRRGMLQALVDELRGKGLSSSKIRNVMVAVRVVFRHAIEREWTETNPTAGLRLPNGVGRRDRAASASEAAELLAALPVEDRALWATAFYGGLRRGELRGLRWSDVNLANGVITVRRSIDDVEGEIAPKSAAGSRTVPLTALLRDHLAEQKARTGRTVTETFSPTLVRRRANTRSSPSRPQLGRDGHDPLTAETLVYLEDGGYIKRTGTWNEPSPRYCVLAQKGREIVAGWPSGAGDALLSSLVAQIDHEIDLADTEDEKSRLRRFRDFAVGVGRDVMVTVLGSYAERATR